MSYWVEKLKKIIIQQEEDEIPISIDSITNLRLSEFARRDIAVEIYSEYLGGTLWLCSNDDMVLQINRDDPEKICYTVEEIYLLLKLKPSVESLKKIHEAKTVFPNSKLKEIIEDNEN